MLRSPLLVRNPAFDSQLSKLAGACFGSWASISRRLASSLTRTEKYRTKAHATSGSHLKTLIASIAAMCEAQSRLRIDLSNAAVARQSIASWYSSDSGAGLDTFYCLLSKNNLRADFSHLLYSIFCRSGMSSGDQPRCGDGGAS